MIESLTQSAINMYCRCGHQFYERYVKGIVIPPGVAARRGSSVHAGAELGYRGYVEKGEYPPVDEIADATRDEFVKLVTNEGVWLADDEKAEAETILGKAQDDAVASAKSYRNQVAPSHKKIGLIEERLYADLDAGIPISGKPDVVADGKMPDIKTSGKRWGAGTQNTKIQPVLYRILLRENGFGDAISPEFIVLTNMKKAPKNGAALWDAAENVCIDIRKVTVTPEREESVMARVRTVAKLIQQGCFPPADPDSWACSPKWCGYYPRCPYSRGIVSVTVPGDIADKS